jgi:phage shock protein PspC (stress-responsive transcriptional regulator)/FtsH-binding integral membrane protein
MTTSDTVGGFTPPPASGERLLRRNTNNRVAAGVASGLGDYFRVDPVLFRVLFATAAFFGGAGILAYLLAWAAIPEAGTAHAPIDGFIGWIRRRRFPMWLAAIIAGFLLWAVAFSWWAPHHFFPVFPVIAIVILLIVFYGRREMQAAPPAPSDAPVDLTKDAPPDESTGQPSWPREARSWFDDARDASRARRRRAMPVRVAMLVTLVVTLTVLGIVDAVTGIQLQVYFWTVLGILVAGLLVGLVTRRTPLSMIPLLIPSIAGVIAFAGSHASLHDGVGQREWKPTGAPASEYRLAFGQGILDLRHITTPATPQTIDVTMGAGQVHIIAPKTLNLTVLANIHIGELEIDGNQEDAHGGVGLTRTVDPPRNATGTPITVNVHLADGQIAVEHR